MEDGDERGAAEAAPTPQEPLAARRRRAYRTLVVPPGAPLEQVRFAYQRLLWRYHPVRYRDDPLKREAALRVCARIREAYATLAGDDAPDPG